MPDLRIGELFSGYGGLGGAVQSVLGGDIAWHSEIDPGACKILAHRYPDVPNLGDITTVDWSAVAPVDVLTGGFPCQDVSAAGKRAGIKPGTRSGLWSEMHRAITALRPPLVVIENVRGLLSATAQHPAHGDVEPCPWCMGDDEPVALRALGAVLGDLADIGYDASWQGLRAADVGAPHGRFRVFVVAWPAQNPDVAARGERRLSAPGQAQGWGARADTGGRGGAPAADPEGDGRHEGRAEPAGLIGGSDAALSGDATADADSDGLEGVGRINERHPDRCGGPDIAWGDYEPAIRRWEHVLGRLAPPPTETSPKGAQRLSPAFVEFMQGLPAGWVTDPAIWDRMTNRRGHVLTGWRLANARRNAQLHALGNGVVPQQAAAALRLLLPGVAS